MAAPKPNARHSIMEAALVEFAETGYDRTTMEAIATRAGVAKGSLYYHFVSKEALFRALFEERAQHLANLTHEAVQAHQWEGAMRSWADFFWREKDFLELFLSEAWRNREREALVQRFLGQIVQPLAPLFGENEPHVLGYALFGAIAVPALHLLKQEVPRRMELDHLVATLSEWMRRSLS